MPTAKKKKPAKIENTSSVTKAFQELRELIVRGNLPPGAWIVEAEIAERLGLSRTPIRGALQWLHREGYVVEHKGNRKARIAVAPLTLSEAATGRHLGSWNLDVRRVRPPGRNRCRVGHQ